MRNSERAPSHDDVGSTTHARQERSRLSTDAHDGVPKLDESPEASSFLVRDRGRSDPSHRSVLHTEALVREGIVQQLHALSRPHERDAGLKDSHLALKAITCTGYLGQQVSLADNRSGGVHMKSQ